MLQEHGLDEQGVRFPLFCRLELVPDLPSFFPARTRNLKSLAIDGCGPAPVILRQILIFTNNTAAARCIRLGILYSWIGLGRTLRRLNQGLACLLAMCRGASRLIWKEASLEGWVVSVLNVCATTYKTTTAQEWSSWQVVCSRLLDSCRQWCRQ